MSRVCSELRRIWRTNRQPIRPAPAPAAQPSAAKPRASPPAPTTAEIYRQPSLDLLVSTFKMRSVSANFRNRYVVYSYTIDRLAKHSRFSAIADILQEHKQYPDIAREGYAARLLRLYGSAGMFQHAHDLFDELPDLNCRRTVLSFNALLGAALHSKEFETACDIFRTYPSKLGVLPDVISYNTVIKALAELGLLDVAISKVDEMLDEGRQPDLITFNSIVDGAYMHKGFSEGEKVWFLLLEKITGLVPDIKSYNARLNGMINEGMVSEAVDLFEELKIRGLKPNTYTYNPVIKCLCGKGDVEEAKKWYKKLVETDGLLPNWITFEALIALLCSNGDSDLAFGLSKKMLGRHFIVDEALLQLVVDTLVKDSKVDKAKKLVELAGINFYHQYNLVMPPAA